MRILLFLILFCLSYFIINTKSNEKDFVIFDNESHKIILRINDDFQNKQIKLKLFSGNKLLDEKVIINVKNFSLEDIRLENVEKRNIFYADNMNIFYNQEIYFECQQTISDSLTLNTLYSILINTNDRITIHKFNKSEIYLKYFINNFGLKDSINITFNIPENNLIIKQNKESYLIGSVTGFDFNNIDVLYSKFLKIEYNVFGGSGVAIKYLDLILLDRNQLHSSLSIINKMTEIIPNLYDFNYKSKKSIYELKLMEKYKINIKEIIEETNKSDQKSTNTNEYVLNYDEINGIFYNEINNNIKMIKFTDIIYKYSNNSWITE